MANSRMTKAASLRLSPNDVVANKPVGILIISVAKGSVRHASKGKSSSRHLRQNAEKTSKVHREDITVLGLGPELKWHWLDAIFFHS